MVNFTGQPPTVAFHNGASVTATTSTFTDSQQHAVRRSPAVSSSTSPRSRSPAGRRYPPITPLASQRASPLASAQTGRDSQGFGNSNTGRTGAGGQLRRYQHPHQLHRRHYLRSQGSPNNPSGSTGHLPPIVHHNPNSPQHFHYHHHHHHYYVQQSPNYTLTSTPFDPTSTSATPRNGFHPIYHHYQNTYSSPSPFEQSLPVTTHTTLHSSSRQNGYTSGTTRQVSNESTDGHTQVSSAVRQSSPVDTTTNPGGITIRPPSTFAHSPQHSILQERTPLAQTHPTTALPLSSLTLSDRVPSTVTTLPQVSSPPDSYLRQGVIPRSSQLEIRFGDYPVRPSSTATTTDFDSRIEPSANFQATSSSRPISVPSTGSAPSPLLLETSYSDSSSSSPNVHNSTITMGLTHAPGPSNVGVQTQRISPRFRSKAVCRLSCRHCKSSVCTRGMKAILLADSCVELFSTDSAPQGVQLVGSEYLTQKCSCRIRDVVCSLCGNVIGYHVTRPCKSCLEACNNGHFWMFHMEQVTYAERLDRTGTNVLLWDSIPPADQDVEDGYHVAR